MKLTTKVVLTLLIVLMAALSISGWVSIRREQTVLTELLAKQGKTISHAIAVACIEPLLSEDYPVLNTFLNTTGKESTDILSIEVLHNGQLVSEYKLNQEEPDEGVLFGSEVSFNPGENQLPLKLGKVKLTLSTRENKRIIAARLRELVIHIIVSFIFLGLTLVLVMRILVLQKVEKLNRHALRIKEGDLTQKVELQSDDELGQLAATINKMVATISKRTHDLGERVKELNCLYGISHLFVEEDISFDKIMQEAVNLIPASWQYPEICCGRIAIYDKAFSTDQFRTSPWKQEKEILVDGKPEGLVEVYYLEEKPDIFEGPFLNEEHKLLNAFADLLGRIAERIQMNSDLDKYRNHLENMVAERTRDLEKAHQELVKSAFDAGRARQAAMVLHNIGNAVTPIVVQVEMLQMDDMQEFIHVLRQCYDDLNNYEGDLDQYVKDDPRGKQVFAYMEELITALKNERVKMADALSNINSAAAYISEILSLQQAYAATGQEAQECVNINRVVEDALRMYQRSYDTRGIKVERNFYDNIPLLLIDKNNLMQVINNLLKNALEAFEMSSSADREKLLSVQTFAHDELIGFKIVDNGIGVEPDQIESLFEFGRSNKGSSGFGLYYCRQFVTDNDGLLKFTSKGREQGSSVNVSFETKGVCHI